MTYQHMKYLPAEESDQEYFRLLNYACYKDVVLRQLGPWDEALENAKFELKWREQKFKKILVDEQIVGGFWVQEVDDYLQLREIQIHPEHQGRGIGSKVMRDIIKQSQGAGKKLLLRVLFESEAYHLYIRLGFVEISRNDHQYEMEYKGQGTPMIARTVEAKDWNRIAWLASDLVQEGNHKDIDIDWIRNRKAECHARTASVIEIDGEVHAYCALERLTQKDELRAFIVLDWRGDYRSVANAACAQLEKMVTSQNVRMIWMREMSDDSTLITFLISMGFSIEKQYMYQGLELVNLVKYY